MGKGSRLLWLGITHGQVVIIFHHTFLLSFKRLIGWGSSLDNGMTEKREYLQLVGIEFYKLELRICASAAKRLT